jgi:hypothetical protein
MLGGNPDKLLGWLVRRLLSGAHTNSPDAIRATIENALRSEQVLKLWDQADAGTKEDLKREIEAALGSPMNFDHLELAARSNMIPNMR